MKFEKSCGGLIIAPYQNSYKLLLIQHKSGHWGYPKGHVETGESEVQTARREIHEETGLEVAIHDRFRYEVEYSPFHGLTKRVVYFLATITGGRERVQREELSQMIWVDIDKANQFLIFNNDLEILREAKEFLLSHLNQIFPDEAK